MSSSLSREHPLLATIVLGEFSFEVTRGKKMLCASDRLHGRSTEGKDWNELLEIIVEAVYSQKGDEIRCTSITFRSRAKRMQCSQPSNAMRRDS